MSGWAFFFIAVAFIEGFFIGAQFGFHNIRKRMDKIDELIKDLKRGGGATDETRRSE